MKLKHISTAILCLIINISLFSQNPFKKIEVVYYTYDESTDKLDTDFHCEITNKGYFNMKNSESDDISYSSYTADSALTKQMVTFFSNNKPLNDHLATTIMNGHYAGHYTYICVTKANDSLDEFCFITNLTTVEFNEIYSKLYKVFFSVKKPTSKTKLEMNSSLTKRIIAQHKKSTYLPPIEQPPPGMD